MNTRQIYPAIIELSEGGFSLYFPDFKGVAILHEDEIQLIVKAKEVLIFRLVEIAYKKETIPTPTPLQEIELHATTDRVVYIDCNIAPYLFEHMNKSVSANCTIPRWMRDEGKRVGLNFSSILQEGIRDALGC